MPGNDPTMAELSWEVARRTPAKYKVDLLLEECAVRFMSNSELLTARIADHCTPFLGTASLPTISITAYCTAPPPIQADFHLWRPRHCYKQPKQEYADLADGRVVRKLRTGMVFLFNESAGVAIGECLTNTNQILNFINGRYVQWRLDRGGLLLHGAGVAFDDQGIALAGRSGTGKSTLALQLVDKGFDYVSNDELVVSSAVSGLRMHGLPKQPRVNPGTILHHPRLRKLIPPERRRQIQELSPDELWHLEEKHDVDVVRIYGPKRQLLSARLSLLVVLRWRRSDETLLVKQVDLGQRPDLLAAVIKPRGVFNMDGKAPDDGETPAHACIEAMRSCRAVEVSGGLSFKSLADKLAILLGHSPACTRENLIDAPAGSQF